MKKIIQKIFKYQQIRFLFVGGLNTIVGYGSYSLFLYFGLNYLLANTLSYIIGIIHSYFWNKTFTFKSKGKNLIELVKFVSVYLISYLLGLLSLYIIVKKLKVEPYLGGFINLFFTTLISWFGHKYFSFRSKNNEKN